MTELLFERFAYLFGELLRTGDNDTQILEHQRMQLAVARIEPKEGRRSKEHRRFILGREFPDTEPIRRIGVADHRDPLDQRHQRRDRQTERVEDR